MKPNFNNMKNLFVRYFKESSGRDLHIFIIYFSLEAIASLLSRSSVLEPSHLLLYGFTFAVAGQMFASKNSPITGIRELTLPASTADKIIVSYCIIHIYMTLALLICSVVGMFVGNALQSLIWHPDVFRLKPLTMPNAETFLFLFSMQAVFLFGSIYFRKHAILKTITALLTFGFVYLICAAITISAAAGSLLTGIIRYAFIDTSTTCKMVAEGATLLFCWLISYVRLKETEI